MSTDAGILYDPDETEHLPKKLTDLGMCFFPVSILDCSLSRPRNPTRHLFDRHR